ncbi:MAG: TIGR02444 family protein [Sneathiella sp.]
MNSIVAIASYRLQLGYGIERVKSQGSVVLMGYSADEFPPCALWDYAVEIYGEKKVSDACLSLQDRHDIDVNLLLFCLWNGARGWRELTVSELSQAIDISSNWQSPVITPLRHARSALKNSNSPVDEKFKQQLRKAILDSELYAERLELQMLSELVKRAVTKSREGQACASNGAKNLSLYINQKITRLNKTDMSDILSVWQAAFPDAKEEMLIEILSSD